MSQPRRGCPRIAGGVASLRAIPPACQQRDSSPEGNSIGETISSPHWATALVVPGFSVTSSIPGGLFGRLRVNGIGISGLPGGIEGPDAEEVFLVGGEAGAGETGHIRTGGGDLCKGGAIGGALDIIAALVAGVVLPC